MPLRHRRWTILDQTLLKPLPYPFRHLRSSDGQGHGHASTSPGPRKSSLLHPQSTAMRPRTKCFTNYSSFVTAFFFFLQANSEFLALAEMCEIMTVTLCQGQFPQSETQPSCELSGNQILLCLLMFFSIYLCQNITRMSNSLGFERWSQTE